MADLIEAKCRVSGCNNKYIFQLDESNIYHPVVKWFINQYNKSKISLSKLNYNYDFVIQIVFHDFKDLFRREKHGFSQRTLTKKASKIFKFPIIHLTWFDVHKENEITNENCHTDCSPKEQWLLSGVSRYKKIMDSSIWNYYVPVFNSLENDSEQPNPNLNRLHDALVDINYNYCFGHYSLSIAHEYADLHARILENSYLVGCHKAVSPFLFHSEGEMDIKMQDLVIKEKDGEKKVIEKVKEYKWRFLLVDDKSIRCMSKVSLNGNNSQEVNKLQVISNNLSKILGFNEEQIWFRTKFEESQDSQKKKFIPLKCGRVKDHILKDGEFKIINKKKDKEENIQIIIDCVENIEDAKKCLKYYEYEIILLDYLLNKYDVQEYGYQLLKDLYYLHKNSTEKSLNNKMEHIKIGPNNSLSIMFISAFTTAVHERILEMGLGKFEKGLWYIGNSACPTNTPYLFSYLLLQVMRHRINDLKKGSEREQFTIIDLLEEIFVKEGRFDIENVRKKANRHFNHLLFMRAKYKRLRNDLEEKEEKELRGYHINSQYVTNYLMDMNSSLLVYSAFKVVHHFSEAFFDHLQHLIYLTAFGTIRQWQDMWEEYEFVYKELYEYDNYVVDNEGKKQDRGKKICNAIKEYIINLKENSI